MNKTRLVIVGGVAGGATAAARARRLSEDAEIVVLERGPDVSFANCGLPYHVGGEIPQRKSLLLQTPQSLRTRYGLDVRVCHEVLSVDRSRREVVVRDTRKNETYRQPYDKLILSPGASPVRLPIPGIDHHRVFTVRTVQDAVAIKKVVDEGARSAVVVGGGFIGLEMAENLRRRGLAVHLVELLDQVMPPLDKEMATAIHQSLALGGVQLHLGTSVVRLIGGAGTAGRAADAGDGGRASAGADADSEPRPDAPAIRAVLKDGTALDADLVVLAVGVRPESKLAREAGLEVNDRGGILVNAHMQTSDPDVYAVGDAVVVRDYVGGSDTLIPLAGPANRQGRIAADHVFGRASAYRGTQGTSVVRVFNLAVAMTGASEKVLRRSGIAYEKVYLHPSNHVTYYPGATSMHLKLLFSKPEGRVLGAQIVGGEGVDKRIDVLALAVQKGMTVFDLEEAELAYAPQYGAAKDPINMAGFIAANVLRGDVDIAHADQLEGCCLLDVRTPDESEAGAIPGSKLIPVDALRSRLGEIPRDKPIAAYCAVGLRGYLAARILSRHGFQVRNLSGGFKTWCAYHPTETDGVCARQDVASCEGPTVRAEAPARASAEGGSCGASLETGSCDDGAAGAGSAATVRPLPEVIQSPADAAVAQVLDVRTQQCPGPILAMRQSLERLQPGQVLKVLATDAGFVNDAPGWCRQTGHELLEVRPVNGHYAALIRKRAVDQEPVAAVAQREVSPKDKTIVVFSNDLDRVLAAFVIANGAASTGRRVTLFFTFWGLNVLRREQPAPAGKPLMDRMFGWMMPKGPDKLSLSKMHMAGMGTAMMKRVMQRKNVAPLKEMIATARASGIRLVACSMSMDVMGIKREEMIDGVEIGGVAAYLAAADDANVNLFI